MDFFRTSTIILRILRSHLQTDLRNVQCFTKYTWLLEHHKANGLFPSVQSAYRKCHSAETAMARVLSDILMALDRGDVAALALLDLSAAFDTVGASYSAVSANRTASAAWRSLGSVRT